MTKKNQHVVPYDGGWAVRKEGGKKVTRFACQHRSWWGEAGRRCVTAF